MATLKPTTPLHAPEQQPLKPPSPMRPKNAPKTPISHPQRRWRFPSRIGRRPQRRQGFQTTGPSGLQDPDAIPVGGGGAWPGFETTHQATRQRHSTAGVEGAGGTGGPGCGARGRWRGLAGLRDDAPSEARGADGERAGRPRGGRRSVGAAGSRVAISRAGRRPRRSPAHACGKPRPADAGRGFRYPVGYEV